VHGEPLRRLEQSREEQPHRSCAEYVNPDWGSRCFQASQIILTEHSLLAEGAERFVVALMSRNILLPAAGVRYSLQTMKQAP
jgi:hypothetical protein